jgi:hypothetical protein
VVEYSANRDKFQISFTVWYRFCKYEKIIEKLARRMLLVEKSLEHIRTNDHTLPGATNYAFKSEYKGIKGEVLISRDEISELTRALQKIHHMMTGKTDEFFDKIEEQLTKGEKTSRKEALKLHKGEWTRAQKTKEALNLGHHHIQDYIWALKSEMEAILAMEKKLQVVERLGKRLIARYKPELRARTKPKEEKIALKALYRHATAIDRGARRATKELEGCKKELKSVVRKLIQEYNIEERERIRVHREERGIAA